MKINVLSAIVLLLVVSSCSTTTIVAHILDTGTIRMEMGYASAIATILFLFMILTRNVISLIIKSD